MGNTADFLKALQEHHYARQTGAVTQLVRSGSGCDPYPDYLARLMVHFIVKSEEHICLIEQDGCTDMVPMARDSHKRMIWVVRSALGDPQYDAVYAALREEHSCMVTNGPKRKGAPYSFYLPKFNDDGTHDPV